MITNTDKNITRKENYRTVSLIKINAKIINNIVKKIKSVIIYPDQVGFIYWMQSEFNILK